VLAFSTTSFMLGIFQSGLVNEAATTLIIPMALIYGGLVQLIIGVLEVFKGNTLGVVVFGSYGPFWIMFGLILEFYAPMTEASVKASGGDAAAQAAAVNAGLAVFLAMFTVLTIFFVIASLRTDIMIFALLALVVVALILLLIFYAGGQASPALEHVAGYIVMIFALIGWYRGLACFLESFWGREVLPVGHFKAAH
jgi:succinate-acetate transporter protein